MTIIFFNKQNFKKTFFSKYPRGYLLWPLNLGHFKVITAYITGKIYRNNSNNKIN